MRLSQASKSAKAEDPGCGLWLGHGILGEDKGVAALDQTEWHDLVKDLAGAVSTQAHVANRAWLALITVALFAVLPHVPDRHGNISLPFNLGDVDQVWFHAIAFSLLIVLTIFFAAAHAQQVRAQKLAQSVVDSIAADHKSADVVHPRELFDMLRTPSLNRVAPLAQLLRGKYQFYSTARSCPRWLTLLSVIYYGLLKVVSLIVFFGLPIWALWRAYCILPVVGWLRIALVIGGLLAGLALVQVSLSDTVYMTKILRHLRTAPDSYKNGAGG